MDRSARAPQAERSWSFALTWVALAAAGCKTVPDFPAAPAPYAQPSAAGAGASAAPDPPRAAGASAAAGGEAPPATGTTAGTEASDVAATAGTPALPTDAGVELSDADASPPDVIHPELGSVGLGSGGIGVSDLDAATDFFTELVGMMVQAEIAREDRVERVLTFGVPGKPSVTLMRFHDERNTKDLPAKLVFYVPSPSAAVRRVSDGGYRVILSGAIGVGQVEAFDGYVLEFLTEANGPTFVALAFAVTDLTASVAFYSDAFGLVPDGQYYAGTLQEEFVRHPDGGAALVVQHYLGASQPNYRDNPVKSVFHVDDAALTLAKLVELGGSMVSTPARLPAFGNRVVAIAKDLDGYVIEIVQREP